MTQRGSYAKGVARREEILRAALDVFAREGYRGTSLREVAKHVGVSLPGLMHYFESKEHLLTAILERRDQQDAVAYRAAGDAVDGLIAVVRHNRDVPGLVQLYITMAAAAGIPTHPANGFARDRLGFLHRELTDAIRARQAEESVRADLDPEHVARMLIAAADGIQLQWTLDPSIDMARDVERLWELIAR